MWLCYRLGGGLSHLLPVANLCEVSDFGTGGKSGCMLDIAFGHPGGGLPHTLGMPWMVCGSSHLGASFG